MGQEVNGQSPYEDTAELPPLRAFCCTYRDLKGNCELACRQERHSDTLQQSELEPMQPIIERTNGNELIA